MAQAGAKVKTPLMIQYNAIKAKHPSAILLFRVGDFYETFGDDAIKTAKIVGITLTKRANGAATYVELAGFPYHALDTYLPKLVRAGQRVAICEQLEDPKKTKKIVKRGVTELVTPGVSYNDNILDNRENNFLASIHIDKKNAGISFLDISTGEFYVAQGNFDYIEKLLQSFSPKEVLFEKSKQKLFKEIFGSKFFTFPQDDWIYTKETANDRLLKQFETKTLKGFGIQSMNQGVIAAGAILSYLDLTEHHQTSHIVNISRIEEDKYVWLDKFTIRNLELFYSLNEGAKTLVDVIDRTVSPMGSRLLKRWVAFPLKDIKPINDRLNVVDLFYKNEDLRYDIQKYIKVIGDIERLISKVAVLRISPREVMQLKNALAAIAPIKEKCLAINNENLKKIAEQLNPCTTIKEKIEKELNEEPPILVNKGNVIADGVSDELDELRKISYSGKDYLLNLQQSESKRTGIASLKIGFNNVFGYFFEVRNKYKNDVPEEWIRKQTLTGAERYINEELKEYESKILTAEEKIQEIEVKLFNDLVFSLSDYIPAIQLDASLIAQLDCLLSFSEISNDNNYVKPEINDTDVIDIKEGRHPVIEKQLPIDEEYVSNNVYLDNEKQQIIMITGPNMSGKSALLRQTALIMIMAQMGCFVPAQATKLGVVDKIFTRVGASDNISLGESTFMVEMTEAASILNNISAKSLILLDEIGRGTSTYDGISIAWAIVEYIHEQSGTKAKTLFATHYHELNEMEKTFSGIKNYNVSVKEINKKIIFLRKLVRGGSEHSFGIHVAKIAGMPKSVVKRASKILEEMENTNQKNSNTRSTVSKSVKNVAQKGEGYQLSIFQLDDPVLSQIRDEIKGLDINTLTPIEALNKLNEIKKITGI